MIRPGFTVTAFCYLSKQRDVPSGGSCRHVFADSFYTLTEQFYRGSIGMCDVCLRQISNEVMTHLPAELSVLSVRAAVTQRKAFSLQALPCTKINADTHYMDSGYRR